jgi:hypothetical protein
MTEILAKYLIEGIVSMPEKNRVKFSLDHGVLRKRLG